MCHEKAHRFFEKHRRKALILTLYYLLYAAFAAIGAHRGWPVTLLSIFLLLILLTAGVGGGGNHYATHQAFEQQPLTAQDLPSEPRETRGLRLPMVLLLICPPALLFFVSFLL